MHLSELMSFVLFKEVKKSEERRTRGWKRKTQIKMNNLLYFLLLLMQKQEMNSSSRTRLFQSFILFWKEKADVSQKEGKGLKTGNTTTKVNCKTQRKERVGVLQQLSHERAAGIKFFPRSSRITANLSSSIKVKKKSRKREYQMKRNKDDITKV